MSRTMTQEERYRMMTEKPISRLIPGLAVPTIISMLITSIYNMADTFFVSQINTSASAAVGIIFSLMAMIQAVGFTLGMGAGNYISRSLGAKNEDIAVRTAATAFFTAIGIGVVMAVTGLSFLGPAGAASGGHRDHRPLRQGLCPVHSSGSAGDDRFLCDEQPAEVPGLCRLCHGGDHHRRDLKHDPGSGVHLRSPHGYFRRGGRHGHKPVRQLLHPVFPV